MIPEIELKTFHDLEVREVTNRTDGGTEIRYIIPARNLRKSIINHIKYISDRIKFFKAGISETTSWRRGQDIREFLNTSEAIEFGKLLGKRDILIEIANLSEEDLK